MAARFLVRHSTQQVESTARSSAAARPEAFDREALAQFTFVRRAACRLTRNVPEAEDLVQDTYVRALRACGRFRSGTNLKAWLLTILRHAHLNRRRQAARAIVEVDEEKVGTSRGMPGTPTHQSSDCSTRRSTMSCGQPTSCFRCHCGRRSGCATSRGCRTRT